MRRAALLLLAACGAASAPPVGQPAPAKSAPTASAPTKSPYDVIDELVVNVRGRVALDGAPVPFFGIAYVSNVANGAARPKPVAIHTKDGTFATTIPWGRWDLIIAAPGAARRVIAGVDVGAKLDLGTISLDRGHTLSGVVRDEAGQPVAGARVDFESQLTFGRPSALEELMSGNISTETDAAGHYTIRGVSRTLFGPPLSTLVASLPGRSSLPVVAPDADASIDLQVAPAGELVITVTGGTAVAVTASARGAVLFGKRRHGAWHFEHVPAGAYNLVVRDAPLHPRAQQSVTVQPDAVETATIALPAQSPVEVAITSTKATCTEIQLRDLDDQEVAIAPCADRVARFPSLEPGTYIACVDKHACSAIMVDDAPAQQNLDVPR